MDDEGVRMDNIEDIYNDLLNKIISLEYKPGQMISENQMVVNYGVSRTMIRAAFIKLKEMGFIEVYPKQGTYISHMDIQHISNIMMLRTAVEKEVIYELYTVLSEDDRKELISKLEANLKEQEKCRHERDYTGKFPQYDAEFHNLMIDSVGRRPLMQLLDQHMLHIARWRNFDVAFDNRIPALIEEHRNIVNSLKLSNPLAAEEAMGNHLETIKNIAVRAIANYPSYFRT